MSPMETPFDAKALSNKSLPQPSGRESANTPYKPSKGIGSALFSALFKGNLMGDISNPRFIKLG